VLHIASPLGSSMRDPDALIRPAREGTLRVLRAAIKAGVKRVVMTSSTAACTPPPQQGEYFSDETVWTDANDPGLDSYRKSKVLAERAAWNLINERVARTTLTTILPSAIFGPVLTPETLSSVQFIQRLLEGRPPGIPHVGMCVVDVRDVADLHVRAMTSPAAAGERLIAAGEFLWMGNIATILRDALGEQARKVPTRALPDFVIRLMAWALPAFRSIPPMLGRELKFSSEKAHRLLGFAPRAAGDTILDCAHSLFAARPGESK
jgi:dihydroflavonol-4-reductase